MPLIQWIMQNLAAAPLPPAGVVVGGKDVASPVHNQGSLVGVVIGSTDQSSRVNVSHCNKPPLPLNPHPSIADYRPVNVAPLIDFFTPIASFVLGENLNHCNLEFRYENNTPCNPLDDIFVRYPTCIGIPYTPPGPHPCSGGPKSPALRLYEQYAKKSQRLYDFMITSPAHIVYFHDICFHD